MPSQWTGTDRLAWSAYVAIACLASEILLFSGNDSIVSTVSIPFVFFLWIGVLLSFLTKPAHIAYISFFCTIVANYDFWFDHVRRKIYLASGSLPATVTLAIPQGDSILAMRLPNGSYDVYFVSMQKLEMEEVVRKTVESHQQVFSRYSAYYGTNYLPTFKQILETLPTPRDFMRQIPHGALSAMLILSVPVMLFVSVTYRSFRTADRRAAYIRLIVESKSLSESYKENIAALKLLKEDLQRVTEELDQLEGIIAEFENSHTAVNHEKPRLTDLREKMKQIRTSKLEPEIGRLRALEQRMSEDDSRLLEIQAETANIRRDLRGIL